MYPAPSRVWEPGTTISLCRVPWFSDYQNIVNWRRHDRDAYFKSIDKTDMAISTLVRPGEPFDILMSANKAFDYNYVIVSNPNQLGQADDKALTMYYFITGIHYLAPETTRLTVSCDVITTFLPTIKFGNAFIERGHIGLANENATLEPASLNRYQQASEGLDIGSNLSVSTNGAYNLYTLAGAPNSLQDGPSATAFLISTVSLYGDFGTIDAPKLETAHGTMVDHMPCAAEVWCLPANQVAAFFSYMSRYPWITQNIITCYLFPSGFVSTATESLELGGVTLRRIDEFESGVLQHTHGSALSIPVTDDITNDIPEEYRIIKKLWTSQFTHIVLSTNDGQSIDLALENMKYPTMAFRAVGNLLMPFARIGIYVADYNVNNSATIEVTQEYGAAAGDESVTMSYSGECLDTALWFDDFPQVPIINDGYMGWLANTSYMRQYNNQVADRNKAIGLEGNRVAKSNALNSAGTGLTESTNNIQLAQANKQLSLANGFIGMIGGQAGSAPSVASGMAGASPMMKGLGVASQAGSQLANIGTMITGQIGQQGAINAMSANTSLDYAANVANINANNDYANLATNTQYQNTIQGILAQVQQAQITSPSMSGQFGGNGMAYSTAGTVLRYRVMTPQPGVMNIIGNYLLRYGIAINEFMPLDDKLSAMNHFSYIKCKEVYITDSRCTEAERATIRGILEAGTTIWENPSEIGVVALADNQPLEGIAY